MKFFSSIHVATLVFLLCSACALAQTENVFLLAVEPQGMDNCLITQEGLASVAYLCLWNPVNPNFGQDGVREVEFVGGFECRFWVVGNVTILGLDYPVMSVDVGSSGSHIVGFSEPVPVTVTAYGSVVVLATIEVLYGGRKNVEGATNEVFVKSPVYCEGAGAELYVGEALPHSSVEGLPAYLDAEDFDDPIVGATCTTDLGSNYSLLFLEGTVSAQAGTWESIKSMYR